MKRLLRTPLIGAFVIALTLPLSVRAQTGVGTQPPAGAEVLFDGTRHSLDKNWTYWEGPCFVSALPIKWNIVEDQFDGGGTVLSSKEPYSTTYGEADIVTKKAYRDFRLHVEFLIPRAQGNSGVYLQNRYEIQIVEGERGLHGMAAVINEKEANYDLFNGLQKWNAYDIQFRAARFQNGKRTEPAMVTMYFNGTKVHENTPINQVWGGICSATDGANDGGKGITDTPGGLKLQAEGHDIRYRNIWIVEKDFSAANTNF
ncbi:MAG: DUF1080 domain-containing protein [Rhodothermales bacterium]